MIKAVLFDMDGILYDSEGFYMQGTYNVMKSFGYKDDIKNLNCVVGTTCEGTYALMAKLLNNGTTVEQIEKANVAYYVKNPLPYKEIMFEGIPSVLEDLSKRGYKMACCSSSPEQCILDSLDAMGIRQYFDFVESGDNIDHPKPAGDIYEMAAKALGVTSDECIVYEDSRMGIEAGHNANMKVIARRDDRFGQDQSEADFIVNDVYEMKQIVLQEG